MLAIASRPSHAVAILRPAAASAAQLTTYALAIATSPVPVIIALSSSPPSQEKERRGRTSSDIVQSPSSVISVISLNVKGHLARTQGADAILQADDSTDIMASWKPD